MNKLVFFMFGALVVLTILFISPRAGAPVGIALNEPQFSVATNAQRNCAAAPATTTALAAGTYGSSAVFENASSTAEIYLCRATHNCTATSTVAILAPRASSTALSRFVQTDGYVGHYLCSSAPAGGALLNVSYAP